jgi:hypothetical protein
MKLSEMISLVNDYLSDCRAAAVDPAASELIELISDAGMAPPPLPFKAPKWIAGDRRWEDEVGEAGAADAAVISIPKKAPKKKK